MALRVETYEEALLVLQELERRASLAGQKEAAESSRPPILTPYDFVEPDFPAQNKFLQDPSHYKAALCTRRAGKSYGIGKWLIAPLFEAEGLATGYFALTRGTAKAIMWRNVLKVLDKKFKLNAKFYEADLIMELPNESILCLEGADANENEMEKFLGRKYRRLAVDECQSFRQDLRRIVYEILEPTLGDLDGEMALTGTVGKVAAGLFYDVTRENPTEPGWSVHEWSWEDNPHVAENIRKRIARMIERDPKIVNTPAFKRSWAKPNWETDTSLLCYKYDQTRKLNWVPELPNGTYFNVFGLDLGFENATAYSVLSFNPNETENVYIRESRKEAKKDLSHVERELKRYAHRYSIMKWIVDGASKQAVEELKNRTGLPLEAAQKQGKSDFIEIMDSDYLRGAIKLVGEKCTDLEEEYADLVWDEKILREKKRKEENGKCANDAADSALYPYRFCWNYLYNPDGNKGEKKTDDEKLSEWEAREAEKLEFGETRPFWERV